MIPEWLEPIRAATESISATDLMPWSPPDDANPRASSVLLLFGEGEHGPDILLTERSHDLRSHPGQISFPGGRTEEGESAVDAALREAREEVGLDPTGVEVFAELPELWLAPSNHSVTPVIAWWREESPVFAVDPAEVRSVLRAPLSELLDPRFRVTVTHPIGYASPGFLIGPDNSLVLWGFTAGVLSQLFDYTGMARPWDRDVRVPVPEYFFRLREDQQP